MGTLYTSQSAAGYNSSPPPDDGSQGANNQITWGTTIKAKLADPIKALADAINSQLTTALDLSPRAISTPDSAVASDHWRTLEVTGTTTITLSDAATMTKKYVVGIANLGVGTVTVTRATGANTVNGTAADFTIPPKTAVVLGVNQGATGYNIISSTGGNSNNTSLVATTSVTTPTVTSPAASNLVMSAAAGAQWSIEQTSGILFPGTDNVQDVGKPGSRLAHVFTPIIDSGTTGSLLLKTNNGTTGLEVRNIASAVNFLAVQGGTTGSPPDVGPVTSADTDVGMNWYTKGIGTHSFRTAGSTVTQFQVLHTASATRNITVTGSNGGNPTISTTAGSLAITPSVVISGSQLQIGTNPSNSGFAVCVPYGDPGSYSSRNNANSGNYTLIQSVTTNSVADTVKVGFGSVGVLIAARSGAGAPALADLLSGAWMLWRDTSGATTKLYYNNAGTLQSVALV
jgi:hypothetical protein